MAYAQVNINVKNPSKKMEDFIREIGVKKHQRLEDLRERKIEDKEVKVK